MQGSRLDIEPREVVGRMKSLPGIPKVVAKIWEALCGVCRGTAVQRWGVLRTGLSKWFMSSDQLRDARPDVGARTWNKASQSVCNPWKELVSLWQQGS